MKKTLSLLLLTLTISLTFISCGGKKTSELSTKNNVVWWNISDITNLIPYVATDASAPYVYQLIWEPMNQVDPRTQDMIPWITTLPEISADHLTYTYTVNKNVTFSDGKPLTGEDIIFSFKTVKDPNILDASPLRNYVNSIDSCNLVGGDPYKVAFHLNKAYFQMDRVIGGGYVLILPKHIFDATNLTDKINWADMIKGEPAASGPVKEYADHFTDMIKDRTGKYYIGSGPYLFKEWKTNSSISITKSKNYWGKDIPWGEAYPEEIIFKTISDQNAAITELKAKGLDFMEAVPPTMWTEMNNPYIKKDNVYFNQYTFIAWNNDNPLFKDVRVRWALSHLVNREQINKTILKGLYKNTDAPVMFTQPNAPKGIPGVEFNLDTAKKLLADAGWTDSDGDGILDKVIDGKKTPFKFTFLVNLGNEVRKQILLVVVEQLRKAGISAEIRTLEATVEQELVKTHDYEACYYAWAGNAAEDDIYQLWHSSQSKNKGSNFYSFKNAEADKMLDDVRMEFDRSKRDALMQRFCQIVHDEQPVTFLFASPSLMGRVDRFDNVAIYTQRPGVSPQYWVVRGGGITPNSNLPSTIKATASN
jgi:peptide/nickel transport system substrate-binding protein